MSAGAIEAGARSNGAEPVQGDGVGRKAASVPDFDKSSEVPQIQETDASSAVGS